MEAHISSSDPDVKDSISPHWIPERHPGICRKIDEPQSKKLNHNHSSLVTDRTSKFNLAVDSSLWDSGQVCHSRAALTAT